MNRIVIVTGSTRGIGYATAAEFLKHGDRVVVLCRHRNHVEKALKELTVSGKREDVLGLVADIRKTKDVGRIVDRVLEHFGRIDVLVNNAGVAVYRPIEETTDDDWDRILDTNLKGT
ncbi:MAG: SDR family NAD(P)-dependent oxidoreductase, partial [Syntrophales bacterium]|nr:SDR family NAD(P)-dependent oxidoreductase [Syntrophales bacterium]